jgi:hypothetical protein
MLLHCRYFESEESFTNIDLKGTHARDFHSLILNFCFASFSHKYIDTKYRTTNIFENLIQIRLDIQNFHSLPVFAVRCHQKREGEFIVAFITLLLQIVLRVFGKKVTSNFTRRSVITRFRQIRRVKWCVFCDNAVCAKIEVCRRILNLIYKKFKFWISAFGLFLNDIKNCEKRTIKSRSCVPLKVQSHQILHFILSFVKLNQYFL